MAGQKISFRKVLYALMAAGILAAIYFAFAPRAVEVETARVRRGRFEETLKADAKIRARKSHVIRAVADGDIFKRVDYKAGDPVKKGEGLTKIYWGPERVLRSPADGVISKIYFEGPGPIRRGDPILEIVESQNLEVVAEVLTTDAVRLKAGLPLAVEGWGGSGPLRGRIVRISQAGYTKISALGVEEERAEVRAELVDVSTEALVHLGDNYHADVFITLSVHDDVLSVPLGALFKEGSGKDGGWRLFRVVDGRARGTPIEIGLRNDREAMVTGGLTESDTVILYPGDLVKEGSKVRN